MKLSDTDWGSKTDGYFESVKDTNGGGGGGGRWGLRATLKVSKTLTGGGGGAGATEGYFESVKDTDGGRAGGGGGGGGGQDCATFKVSKTLAGGKTDCGRDRQMNERERVERSDCEQRGLMCA